MNTPTTSQPDLHKLNSCKLDTRKLDTRKLDTQQAGCNFGAKDILPLQIDVLLNTFHHLLGDPGIRPWSLLCISRNVVCG